MDSAQISPMSLPISADQRSNLFAGLVTRARRVFNHHQAQAPDSSESKIGKLCGCFACFPYTNLKRLCPAADRQDLSSVHNVCEQRLQLLILAFIP